MSTNPFIHLAQRFAPVQFDTALHERFQKIWIRKTFPKRTFLTEAGNTERYLYYVIKGITTVYLIDQAGKQMIMGFAYDNEFSGDYESYLYQKPSNYFVEALTDCEVLALSLTDFNALFDTHPDFHIWEKHFLRMILMGRAQREVEMLTLSASERFEQFMARCPAILQQLPQRYLASYLNMTPETFSRMRANAASRKK